jgi:galactosylxylosylprotein 3-beta-galactosyltransferase
MTWKLFIISSLLLMGVDMIKSNAVPPLQVKRLRSNPYTTSRPPDHLPLSITSLSLDNGTTDSRFIMHHVIIPNHLRASTLLILVQSLSDHIKWRSAIRQSWKETNNITIVVFAVPVKGLGGIKDLVQESQAHKDMILYLQVEPGAPKSAQFIHYTYWITRLYTFKYLLRTHDNYYVRVRNVLDKLAPFASSSLNVYMGYFRGNVTVKDPKWFLCSLYTPHADEGAYIMSNTLISRLLKQLNYLSYYDHEGSSIGLWLSIYKDVSYIHSVDFNVGISSRGCWNSLVVGLITNQQDMNMFHERCTAGQLFCQREYEIEQSYKYNWSKQPSQCCYQQAKLINT